MSRSSVRTGLPQPKQLSPLADQPEQKLSFYLAFWLFLVSPKTILVDWLVPLL